MELEGGQLEHVAKNRKHLQAAKDEAAAHTATAFSQSSWDVLLAVQGEDRLLSVLPLCCTDLQSAAWWSPHGGGIWRWEPVRKHTSVWSRFQLLSATKGLEQSRPDEEVILPTSERVQKQKPSYTWLLLGCMSPSCASHGGCTDCMCSSWRWPCLSLCSCSNPLQNGLLLSLMGCHNGYTTNSSEFTKAPSDSGQTSVKIMPTTTKKKPT